MLQLIVHVSLIFSTFAISQSLPSTNQGPAAITTGQIIEKIVCQDKLDQSYALYLPSGYTPARKWPILYAFDPGARGKIPVEHYKDAAEKFGWIVVGSNNSRNAAWQTSLDAWNAITKDTHDRFAIDDRLLYAAGFSGGARVAILFAIQCEDCLAGVIASGAGFPPRIEPAPTMHFALFGTTGFDDFNFPEVKALDDRLGKVGIPHQIEVFDGSHEWPPADVASHALEWMELQAMKTGKRPRDTRMIDSLWQGRLEQARGFAASKKTYEAYQAYSAMVEEFRDLHDVVAAQNELGQLRTSTDVKNAIRDEQRQISRQREIEARLRSLIAASQIVLKNDSDKSQQNEELAPKVQLHDALTDLRKQAARPEDTGDRRVARRVLNGTFVGLFEQGTNELQTEKRYQDAVQTFALATEVNPERAGPFYYLAWAYAAKGDKKKSLQALKTAIDKGFSDLAAITDNKAFDLIRDDAQYRYLLQTIQSRH